MSLSVCLFLCVSVFSRERHNVQMLRASLSETSGIIIYAAQCVRGLRVTVCTDVCEHPTYVCVGACAYA